MNCFGRQLLSVGIRHIHVTVFCFLLVFLRLQTWVSRSQDKGLSQLRSYGYNVYMHKKKTNLVLFYYNRGTNVHVTAISLPL